MQYLLRMWLFFFGASQMWLSSYKMHLVAVTHTSKCCVRMWWEQNTQLLCGIGNRMSSIWILGTNQFQWENVVGFSVGSLFFWPEWPLIRCAHTYYSSRGDDVDSVLLFFRFSLFCINVTLEAFERLTMLNSNSKQNEEKQWHNKWNRSMERAANYRHQPNTIADNGERKTIVCVCMCSEPGPARTVFSHRTWVSVCIRRNRIDSGH